MKKLFSFALSVLLVLTSIITGSVITSATSSISADLNELSSWTNVGKGSAVYGDTTTYNTGTYITGNTAKSHDSDGKSLKISGYNGYMVVADLTVEKNKDYTLSFWFNSDNPNTTHNSGVRVYVIKEGQNFGFMNAGYLISCGAKTITSAAGGGYKASDAVSVTPNPAVVLEGIQADTWYEYKVSFNSYDNEKLGLVISTDTDHSSNLYLDEISVTEGTTSGIDPEPPVDPTDLNELANWTNVGKGSAVYGDTTTYNTGTYITGNTAKSHDSDGKSLKISGYSGYMVVADLTVEKNKDYTLSFWFNSDNPNTTHNSGVRVYVIKEGQNFGFMNAGYLISCGAKTITSAAGGGYKASDAVSVTPNPAVVLEGIQADTWYEYKVSFNSYDNEKLGLVISTDTDHSSNLYLDEISVTEGSLTPVNPPVNPDDYNSVYAWTNVGLISAVYGDSSTYGSGTYITGNAAKSHDDDGKSLKITGYNGNPVVTDLTVEKNSLYKIGFWYCYDTSSSNATDITSAARVYVLRENDNFGFMNSGILISCGNKTVTSKSSGGYKASDAVLITPNPAAITDGVQKNTWYKYEVVFNSYDSEKLGLVLSTDTDFTSDLYVDEISVEKVTEVSYIKFDTKGGEAIADQIVQNNVTFTDLPIPTHSEGYSFAGWYSDAAFNNRVSSVTTAQDITLYAKWIAKGGFEQTFEGYFFEGKEEQYPFGYSSTTGMSLYHALSEDDEYVHGGSTSMRYCVDENTRETNVRAVSIFDPTMGKLTLGEKYYISMYVKLKNTDSKHYLSIHSVSSAMNVWADQVNVFETYINSGVNANPDEREPMSELVQGAGGAVLAAEEPDENGWFKLTFELTATQEYFAIYLGSDYSEVYYDDVTITPLPEGVIAEDYENSYCNTPFNDLFSLPAGALTTKSSEVQVYKISDLLSRGDYVFAGEVTDAAASMGAWLQLAWDEEGADLLDGTKITSGRKSLRIMTKLDPSLYLVVYNPYGEDAFSDVVLFQKVKGLAEKPLVTGDAAPLDYNALPELYDLLRGPEYAQIVVGTEFEGGNETGENEEYGDGAEAGEEGEYAGSPETGDTSKTLAVLCLVLFTSAVLLVLNLKKGKRGLKSEK